jgi:dolichyl-diphosphooligosaccharide--protein glycosyltransferase
LQADKELVKVEKSSHYLRYLLIIGVLVLSFSLAFILRAQPLEYGFELTEFDPFFNYRATQFMVENGLPEYLEWHDDLSWHPYGRDVSATSQVMLHTTTTMLYQIFGMGTSLYHFTIWFPLVFSSLTTVVIFAVVRTIGGTSAGLLASLFFAVSPMIIMRGTIGWFKSEPLGLFYGLLAVYLLLSAIKSDKGKVSVAKIVGSGIFLAFGLASWGGVQFFLLPIGLFFLALPFLRKDNKFIIWISLIFVTVFFLVTISFEKTGIAFISSLNGFFLLGCTAFLVTCVAVKKISKAQLRNGLALLGGTIIAGIVIVSSGVITLPSFRYLNAANPFLITTDMLTDSVAEHATTTTDISFYFFSILMIFAGIGGWFLFQKKVNHSLKIKGEMAAFALIIGFLGMYFGSAFVRLEVISSISVIILSSIGVSILISKLLKDEHKSISFVSKISFLAVIVALLAVPMVYPVENSNWSNNNRYIPPTILNSGTIFDMSTNDWTASMQWLKENTPEDAVIASWWDYGYWISTLAERKTLADNATLLDWQIRKLATTFMSTPEDAWHILMSDTKTDVSSHYVTLPADLRSPTRPDSKIDEDYNENQNKLIGFKNWQEAGYDVCAGPGCKKVYDPDIVAKYPTLFDYWVSEIYVIPPVVTGLDADYVVINLAAQKLSDENILPLYTMQQKGGDETKAFWLMKIADLRIMKYYNPGLKNYTDEFWNETFIGKLIPFTPVLYVDPNNAELQSDTFKEGYIAIYVRDIKYPSDGQGPFQLVYVSPSFEMDNPGKLTGPIIYKINKDYNPNQ